MAEAYLKKHLIGYWKDDEEGYVTGKFTGCTKSLIEGYITVTGSGFVRSSSHVKGNSKRFKSANTSRSSIFFSQMSSFIPIPFSGYPFEVISNERWNCNHSCPDQQADTIQKRKAAEVNCDASIQIRTVRLYSEYGITNHENLTGMAFKKLKEKKRDEVFEKLASGATLNFTDVCYCRFPLCFAHHHESSRSSTQLDKRVIKKIRELASNGIYDVGSIKSMIADYVCNTLFAHADVSEKPSTENRRYFPSTKAIRNHIFLAVGSLRKIPGYSHQRAPRNEGNEQPPYSITNVLEKSRKPVSTVGDEIPNERRTGIPIGYIALHAGAGFHSNERWPGYKHLCSSVCLEVSKRLKLGISAGEAVTMAVSMLEDSELTNAGFGSNLTEDGKVECDASVMDTTPSENLENICNSYFGSVACVCQIKNPIQAAYKILCEQRKRGRLELGRIPPNFMVSEGAENWSRAHNVQLCSPEDLISESAYKTWQNYHKKLLEKLLKRPPPQNEPDNFGDEEPIKILDTVGAVALDIHGNTAAAVSSGGLILKLPGRVGQAALYGSGCWAEPGSNDKAAIAIASSGCGEQLTSTILSRKCAENLRKHEQPYQALQDTLVHDFLDSSMIPAEHDKQAGLLCLHYSRDGDNSTIEIVWGHTTSSMVIGHMSTNESSPKILLSKLPETATPGKSVTVEGSWIKVSCSPHIEQEFLSNQCTSSQCQRTNEDMTTANSQEKIGHSPSGPGTTEVGDDSHESLLSLENECHRDNLDKQMLVDGEISVMFLSPLPQGLAESNCEVELSEKFNRKISEDFEAHIESRWRQRVAENPRLFNGQKFRIHSVNCEQTTDQNGSVKYAFKFNLGLTCYKDYMETNWSPDVSKLVDMGLNEYGDTQAYLGEPLGVAAIIITDDDKVVFQWRNSWLAESANKLDVPGGHPEPTDAVKFPDNMTKDTVDFSDLHPDDVLHEIFESQRKEVKNELNVPLENVGIPMLLGLVRNRLSAGRPVAYFVMRCHMTSDVILQCYRKGGAETDESTDLEFFDVVDIVHLQYDQPEIWSQLCPNSKAACTVYSFLHHAER